MTALPRKTSPGFPVTKHVIANKQDINKFGDLEILPSEKILQFKQSLKSELSTDHSLSGE